MSWTQPMCERDWIKQQSKWDGDVLLSIRIPVIVLDRGIEQCAWCGEPTVVGIFVRVDPSTVPYPREVEDDRPA